MLEGHQPQVNSIPVVEAKVAQISLKQAAMVCRLFQKIKADRRLLKHAFETKMPNVEGITPRGPSSFCCRPFGSKKSSFPGISLLLSLIVYLINNVIFVN